MEIAVRVILIAWLVVASLLLFVPAAVLLFGAPQPSSITVLPAPTAPILAPVPVFTKEESKELREERGKAYAKYVESQVSRYEHEVAAYKEYVAALKTGNESTARGDRVGTYGLVVKDTLSSLVNGLVVALAGYVFIKAGGDAAAKYQSAKRGSERDGG